MSTVSSYHNKIAEGLQPLAPSESSGASWVYSCSCQVGPKSRLALVSLECVWLRAITQEKIDQTEKCLVEETSVIKKILKEDFGSKEEID